MVTQKAARKCAYHRHGEWALTSGDSCPHDCEFRYPLGRIRNQVSGILVLAQETREAFEENGRNNLSVEAVIELVRLASAAAIKELADLERMIYEPPELATVGVVREAAGPKAVVR